MTLTIDGTKGITFPDTSVITGVASYNSVISTSYGMRNRIINGDMRIDQRNSGASVTPTTSGYYSCDRWTPQLTQASKFSVQQLTTSPSYQWYSLGHTVTSAYTVTATDYFGTEQRIEGYNLADLNWGYAQAQTITLSFWAWASTTGKYCGSVYTGSASYVFQYTINAVNTWQYITVTIPGPTATYTFGSTTNGAGLYVRFTFTAGTNYVTATPNTWIAGNYGYVAGSVNWIGTSGATLYISGVQFEAGSYATAFDHRLQGTELALCQRYCYRLGMNGTDPHNWLSSSGGWASSTNGFATGSTPVQMRTTPSLVTDSATLSNYAVYSPNGGTFTAITSTSVNSVTNPNNYLLNFGTASGGTAGQVAYLTQNNQTTYGMYLQAEL